MHIVFRADASRRMGSGHVMRMLVLADRLRSKGADVQFVSREHEGHLCDLIASRGFRVERLAAPDPTMSFDDHSLAVAWDRDVAETRAVMGGSAVDWLIVDHYGIDARWETALRDTARKVLVVDDVAD